MTANVTASIDSATIGGGASGIGAGLKAGIYTIALSSSTAGGPMAFTDFTTLKFVDVSVAGARPSSITWTGNIVTIDTFSAGTVTAHVVGV